MAGATGGLGAQAREGSAIHLRGHGEVPWFMELKQDNERIPISKLGHLVKNTKIKGLGEIYLFSLPIKELRLLTFFLDKSLKDEGRKIGHASAEADSG